MELSPQFIATVRKTSDFALHGLHLAAIKDLETARANHSPETFGGRPNPFITIPEEMVAFYQAEFDRRMAAARAALLGVAA